MTLLPAPYTPQSSSAGRLQSNDKLVFQHFPKTGGTTVHNCLAALFLPSAVCPERFGHFASWSEEKLAQYKFFSAHATTRQLRTLPGPLKIISFFRNPAERCLSLYEYWRSIELDPANETNLLEVRFAKQLTVRDFFARTEWEQTRPFWNVYTTFLAGDPLISPAGQIWRSDTELLETALARLEQLAFVGITENMAESMDALCRQLDIPNLYKGQQDNVTNQLDIDLDENNPNGARVMTDECFDLINQANELDKIIYDRALKLARGESKNIRAIRCLAGPPPTCHLIPRFADSWVRNERGGYVLFGPYMRLLPGHYKATFRFRMVHHDRPGWTDTIMGNFEIVAGRGAIAVAACELRFPRSNDEDWSEDLFFKTNHMLSNVEFRVLAVPGAPFETDLDITLVRQ